MPPLLLELWREQLPFGHEQTALDFKANFPTAKSAPLFREVYGVWQRFVTNRAVSPQVIQAERVTSQLFCAARLQRRSLDHRS
jgi:hypothetical protein